MEKHTPGPWRVHHVIHTNGEIIRTIWRADGVCTLLASVHGDLGPPSRTEANAILLARAPEMDEEIKRLGDALIEMAIQCTKADAQRGELRKAAEDAEGAMRAFKAYPRDLGATGKMVNPTYLRRDVDALTEKADALRAALDSLT